jgi:hypothetical protein
MKIEKKSIAVIPVKTAILSDITITNVQYNVVAKNCTVTYNNIYRYSFVGADYDALGQWTDDSLLAALLDKLGAVPASV